MRRVNSENAAAWFKWTYYANELVRFLKEKVFSDQSFTRLAAAGILNPNAQTMKSDRL